MLADKITVLCCNAYLKANEWWVLQILFHMSLSLIPAFMGHTLALVVIANHWVTHTHTHGRTREIFFFPTQLWAQKWLISPSCPCDEMLSPAGQRPVKVKFCFTPKLRGGHEHPQAPAWGRSLFTADVPLVSNCSLHVTWELTVPCSSWVTPFLFMPLFQVCV